jgi:hypothetical protein
MVPIMKNALTYWPPGAAERQGIAAIISQDKSWRETLGVNAHLRNAEGVDRVI